MASFNASELPNPMTPLAFIPPETANQIQLTIYVYVGTLGAYIWDILCNLHNDYSLLTAHRVSLATGVYFFSRLWSLLYILGSTVYDTYPLKDCAALQKLPMIAYAIAVSANSLLFFLRARAIFDRNRIMVAAFFVLWLTVVGTAAATPTVIFGGNIGPTPYCTTVSGKPYAGAIGITPLIHDTVVFLSISWRLLGNSSRGYGGRVNVRGFLTGEYLPRFSKAVLQDGQIYYLSSVAMNLLIVIMFYNQHVAQLYRTMFTVCNVLITNCMACLVFRNTKFGYHKRVATTSEIASQTAGSALVMHRRPQQGGRVNTMLNGVQVTHTTEQTVDGGNLPLKKGEI
ncbi:hypothetical protein K438DRAFT_1984337 [Mycena galopus ATCC 62051]|nr:hypothetical protein K438DRAFT_1984337 [Mycena galopus ATCC 62051]